MPEDTSRPTIGLVPAAAGWFWEVGLQSTTAQATSPAHRQLLADLADVQRALGERLDIKAASIVNSEQSAAEAAELLGAARLDLLVLCHLMWCEDPPLVALLKALPNVPVLQWCYVPEPGIPDRMDPHELFRRSGPAGVLQFAPGLAAIRPRWHFCLGSAREEGVLEIIADAAWAERAAARLRSLRVGLLPARCEVMSDVYLDELALTSRLGPRVRHISVAAFWELASGIPEPEVRHYVAWLEGHFPQRELEPKALLAAARVSLALARLPAHFGINALAIQDLDEELHRRAGVRPCLTVPGMFDDGFSVGMEGDVLQAVACWALRQLTQRPAMFIEIFTCDLEHNALVVGHAGVHDLAMAAPGSVTLTPDYEYQHSGGLGGAWMEFHGLPGPVTLTQFILREGDLTLLAVPGVSLPTSGKVVGFPSLHVQLSLPLAAFMERAIRLRAGHHWALAYGDHRPRLRALAIALDCRYEEIT